MRITKTYLTSAVLAAAFGLAFGLAPAPAEAAPPPGPPPGGGGGEEALTVICPDSIQAAVDQAVPGTPLMITVTGTCTEEVVITANDVTVQGNSILDEVVGGFTITGAQRVTIKSLTIRDGTIDYPVGVFASRGASVVLDDIFVSGQGGAGIYVSRNAYADIFGSTVENPAGGDNALLLNDGAVVRVEDSTFTSANGDPDNGAAVGLFRSASATFAGNIFLENTDVGGGIPAPHGSAEGGGLAVQVLHTSNLRVRSGDEPDIRLVNGDVIIGNNSAAKRREVDVGGDIVVERDSTLNLLGTMTVSGLVTIKDQSLLALFGAADVVSIPTGVTCTDGTAGGVINSAAIDGTVTGCTEF